LGRLVIQIGMSRSEVVRRASVSHQLLTSPLPPIPVVGKTVIVWENEIADTSNRALGNIGFEDDKVKWISKNWTPDRTERDIDLEKGTAVVGDALFGLASSFVRSGHTTCTLSTRTHQLPGNQEQTVTVQCGRCAISVSTTRNDQFQLLSTSVTE